MKKRLLEKAAETLDIPCEIALDIPYITLSGNSKVVVENYMGIISFEENEVKINTKSAILKVAGKGLNLSYITDELIAISGEIENLGFI